MVCFLILTIVSVLGNRVAGIVSKKKKALNIQIPVGNAPGCHLFIELVG
jgi:hypothetical protein